MYSSVVNSQRPTVDALIIWVNGRSPGKPGNTTALDQSRGKVRRELTKSRGNIGTQSFVGQLSVVSVRELFLVNFLFEAITVFSSNLRLLSVS